MERKSNILLPLLLSAVLLLAGCGSSGGVRAAGSGSATPQAAEYYYADYSTPMETQASAADMGWAEETALSGTSANGLPGNVKIIYTADIAMESTEFDAAKQALETLAAECGGWFESSRLDNNIRNYRRAYFTVRVPAERFETFCGSVGERCRVLSLNRGMEDVSEFYYDTESRLATQRTKLSRLQELLGQAENMEDIITLEGAISETELAIEQFTGTLRHYDSLVDYATVSISLSEVYQLTAAEEPVIGFGARLAEAFRSGSSSFVTGLQSAALGFARNWTGWLVFLLVCAAAVLFIVSAVRRRRKRRAAMPPRVPFPSAPRPPVTPAPPTPSDPAEEEKKT